MLSSRNIPKDEFDREQYLLSSDKKILCFNRDGRLKFEFLGSKKDFCKLYGNTIYKAALNEVSVFDSYQKNKFKDFLGCKFKIIDWRKDYE